MSQKNLIIVKFILFFIFIPVAFLTVFFGLNYSGFCFAKMSYLSDDEILEVFFEEINSQKWVFIDTPETNMDYFENLPYENYESYALKYPDCCGINIKQGYDIPPPKILHRIFGYTSNNVATINFNIIYIDKNGLEKSQVFQYEELVNNCGNSFKE